MCVGKITMMMTLLIMAMAVNGGLYMGTILYSAYRSSELDKAVTLFDWAGRIAGL